MPRTSMGMRIAARQVIEGLCVYNFKYIYGAG